MSLHIGSFITVIVYFHKEIINFYKNKFLFIKIFLSSLPIIILVIILVETNIIEKLRNLETLAWITIIFGVLLYLNDKF